MMFVSFRFQQAATAPPAGFFYRSTKFAAKRVQDMSVTKIKNIASALHRASVLQAVVVCALYSATEKAYAAVVYSNLGPNDSFFTSPGTYPVWFLNSGGFIHRAA